MGIEKGARHKVSMTHREVVTWIRTANDGEELRAGRGLYLRLGRSGAFWVYRYVSPVTGKQVRAQLWSDDEGGVVSFPAATLEEAELRAARLRAAVRDGIDPVMKAEQVRALEAAKQAEEFRRLEEERQARELAHQRRLTMSALFSRWEETELKLRAMKDGTHTGRKDSGKYARQQFERHVAPLIGDMTATEVRKSDVLRVIDAQMNAGKQRTAQMVFSDLRQMFAFALDRELIEADPMATLKKARIVGTMTERDRVLSEEEICLLAGALPVARLNPRSECALWLILATGARIGEVMGATWAHDLPAEPRARQAAMERMSTEGDEHGIKVGFVDLDRASWHIPDTKNGREHTIHLSPFALAQFHRLQDLREATSWVFPDRTGQTPVCIKSFGKQIADRQRTEELRMSGRSKAVDALSLPGGKWTAHDLRRTAASLMASLGISGDVIDECLNHVIESRVRRTYIRNRRESEQACAFNSLGAKLSELTLTAHGKT